jgi:(+)-neomenthol dehydrogenase
MYNYSSFLILQCEGRGVQSLTNIFLIQTSGRAANLLKDVFQNTVDEARNCLNTNYYGCKRVTEALLPLLKLSTSGARVVNASSLASELKVLASLCSKLPAFPQELIKQDIYI